MATPGHGGIDAAACLEAGQEPAVDGETRHHQGGKGAIEGPDRNRGDEEHLSPDGPHRAGEHALVPLADEQGQPGRQFVGATKHRGRVGPGQHHAVGIIDGQSLKVGKLDIGNHRVHQHPLIVGIDGVGQVRHAGNHAGKAPRLNRLVHEAGGGGDTVRDRPFTALAQKLQIIGNQDKEYQPDQQHRKRCNRRQQPESDTAPDRRRNHPQLLTGRGR